MKKFLKENIGNIIAISIVAVLLIGTMFFIGGVVKNRIEYNEWYNSLSAEEQTAEREKYIQRYEVLNVNKYIQTQTNKFGGVIGSETCYTFQYIDEGKLKAVDGFRDLEYGLTKVIVGDKNMYIIDDFGTDTYRYLQLTEDTLKNMELSN